MCMYVCIYICIYIYIYIHMSGSERRRRSGPRWRRPRPTRGWRGERPESSLKNTVVKGGSEKARSKKHIEFTRFSVTFKK